MVNPAREQVVPNDRTDPSALRAERDRFLGLAFAAADLLLEIDKRGIIGFASGAAGTLFGRPSHSLMGRSLFDLAVSDQRPLLNRLVTIAANGHRPTPMLFQFEGASRPIVVSAGALPDRHDRIFVTLRASAHPVDGDPGRLLDAAAFRQTAELLLRQRSDDGRPMRLSVIETEGLGTLEGRIGRAVSSELVDEIGLLLVERSIDGAVAGRLTTDRFGFLHEDSVDVQDVKLGVSEILRRGDPEGALVSISSATLDMLGDDAAKEEGVIALRYAINLVASARQSVSLEDLSSRSNALLRGTMDRIRDLKDVVATGRFGVALQPIVELSTRRVNHHEALLRFADGAGPAERVAFAETTGLIADLDLAIVRRVIELIGKARMTGRPTSVSINLSGRSIEQAAFLETLHGLIQSKGFPRGLVMFEITESSQITDLDGAARAIAGIRETGCPVCLDDFGAGASAFHYLRALSVDYVKIDGGYVREVLKAPRDQLFLAAMASLCRDLGVETIGEMVEDEMTARFLTDLGVRFGQGYLFGKPEMWGP